MYISKQRYHRNTLTKFVVGSGERVAAKGAVSGDITPAIKDTETYTQFE